MKDVKTFDARSQLYALPRLRNVLSGCESARITDSRLCHSFSLSHELFMRSHDLNTNMSSCYGSPCARLSAIFILDIDFDFMQKNEGRLRKRSHRLRVDVSRMALTSPCNYCTAPCIAFANSRYRNLIFRALQLHVHSSCFIVPH